MMDKQIIVEPENHRAYCKPISAVKKGDLIVVGEKGVRIKHPERPREGVGVFEFMNSNVSPEKPATSLIREIARSLKERAWKGMQNVRYGIGRQCERFLLKVMPEKLL